MAADKILSIAGSHWRLVLIIVLLAAQCKSKLDAGAVSAVDSSAAAGASSGRRAAATLPSWNDGDTRKAITDFVTAVTTDGSKDFVRKEDRIAVFDNDGTLWSEQPLYFEFQFAIDRIPVMAPQHPDWKNKEPFKSVLAGDIKKALAGGEKSLITLLVATHAGMTTEQFDASVRDWVATARHPRLRRPYTSCVFQ